MVKLTSSLPTADINKTILLLFDAIEVYPTMITSTSEKPENVKRVHQIRIDLVTLCTDKYVQLKLVMLF